MRSKFKLHWQGLRISKSAIVHGSVFEDFWYSFFGHNKYIILDLRWIGKTGPQKYPFCELRKTTSFEKLLRPSEPRIGLKMPNSSDSSPCLLNKKKEQASSVGSDGIITSTPSSLRAGGGTKKRMCSSKNTKFMGISGNNWPSFYPEGQTTI